MRRPPDNPFGIDVRENIDRQCSGLDFTESDVNSTSALPTAHRAGIDVNLMGIDAKRAGIDVKLTGIGARRAGIDENLTYIDVNRAGREVQ